MDISLLTADGVVDVRLSHLVGTVYAGHRLGVWCFSPRSEQLFFSSASHEEQMERLFRLGGCQSYAFSEGRNLSVPFLMSDSCGIVWLGEYATLAMGADMLVLMGPMFYASGSRDTVTNLLDRLVEEGRLDHAEVPAYRAALGDVPIVPAETVVAYARMLHFAITQKTLAPGDIHYQTEKLELESSHEPPKERSWVDYTLLHSQEELFLQCVREGNLGYMEVLNGLNYTVMDLPLADDPVRSERYKIVVNAALSARAAIEGGLSPKIAIDLETKYLRKADRLKKVTELRALNMQLLDDFIQHVHEAKSRTGHSKHIQECCEYVATHLTDDLSIQKIAGEIGYAEYYLTRKFQKEMGVKLTDYIKDARLEYAKVCLLSTELSVEEISDLLQFSSRNYFTRIFREKVGKTPSQFRGEQGLQ